MMTNTATITMSLDLWHILSGLLGSGSLGALAALAGNRYLNGKPPAAALSGHLEALEKLDGTLRAFIDQQREFVTHVAHEHREQIDVIRACASSLAEQSRVLAVVVDRMVRRE